MTQWIWKFRRLPEKVGVALFRVNNSVPRCRGFYRSNSLKTKQVRWDWSMQSSFQRTKLKNIWGECKLLELELLQYFKHGTQNGVIIYWDLSLKRLVLCIVFFCSICWSYEYEILRLDNSVLCFFEFKFFFLFWFIPKWPRKQFHVSLFSMVSSFKLQA